LKYNLLIYTNEYEALHYSPEEFKAVAKAWKDSGTGAAAVGILVLNNGLLPIADATNVMVRNDKK